MTQVDLKCNFTICFARPKSLYIATLKIHRGSHHYSGHGF